MAKFRKKPVVIEAEFFDKDKVHHLSAEFRAAIDKHVEVGVGIDWFIPTLEGELHISDGDWIIKGVAGEFYPCKPDIFEATYERCDEAALGRSSGTTSTPSRSSAIGIKWLFPAISLLLECASVSRDSWRRRSLRGSAKSC